LEFNKGAGNPSEMFNLGNNMTQRKYGMGESLKVGRAVVRLLF
jgi:hypothetical protein